MNIHRLYAGIASTETAGRAVHALAFTSGEKKKLLVAADIMGLETPDAEEIAESIRRRCGLAAADVMVACSGARSGPFTCPAYRAGEQDRVFLREFSSALPLLAESAFRALSPASAGSYRACLPHVSHNERFLTRNRKAVNEWLGVPRDEVLSAEGPGGSDLAVLAVRDASGEIAALLWSYDAEDRFERSLAEAVQREIRQRIGRAVPCLRLAGCGANVAFTYPLGETADLLASSIIAATQEACCDPTAPIGSELRSVVLGVRNTSEFLCRAEVELKAPAALPAFQAEADLLSASAPAALRACAQILHIGGFAIAGLPGNAFSELAQGLKEGSPFRTTCATGHANGTAGYLLPACSFDNGGFETWPARWALASRGSAEFLCSELQESMRRLYSGKSR